MFGASFAKRDAILGRVTCLWRPFMMLCGMLTVCGVRFAELDAILGRVTCLWRPFYDAMWDASLFVASSFAELDSFSGGVVFEEEDNRVGSC